MTNMLKTLQASTGLLLLGFLVAPLLNTWLAALGPDVYDGVQAWFRVAYQFAPFEALLLAAIATHGAVGVIRLFREPRRRLQGRARWHRISGLFLLLVIGGHVLAVRGPSWFYDVYPGFQGLSFSLTAVPAYFYPYYFLLAVAGAFHAVNGAGIALGRLGWGRALPTRSALAMTGTAAVFTSLALLGLGGVLFDVANPYDSDFARLITEITGVTFAP